jgi:hypothetical protein
MATIIASTNDGYQHSGLNANWDNVHDAVGLSMPDTNNTRDALHGVRYEYVTGRGGTKYFLTRAFFDFDVSDIDEKPTDATFNFTSYTNATCTPLIVVKSGHDHTTVTDNWFSTWITGQIVTLSGWGHGDISAYSSSTSVASAGSQTNFILNDGALDDIRDLSVFKICLLHANDYYDIAPTSGLLRTGMYWSDYGSSRPSLVYTPATEAVTDNATFFGTNF